MIAIITRLVAKMDGWARQGEVWREDIESQLSAINKHIKFVLISVFLSLYI